MIVVGLSAAQICEVKEATHEILLYLGLPQASQPKGSSALSADIYASYSEAGGVSAIWVGDLHIDDIQSGSTASPVGEMVSWPLLLGKINECYETHSECQQNPRGSLPPRFRVIDVKRRCLVETSTCRFVALSYVWGLSPQSSPLAALRTTVNGMKIDGGLPSSSIPQTIEDAITICVQLDERYLWADRLCIIQDDAEDLKNQIEAMGEIYSSAQIVLVAAYGDSMNFGIPGISYPRKAVQYCEGIFDLRIINLVRECEDDPLNIWDTRGWTYQEAVLSNRRLYFTNSQAFFECEHLIYHEDQFNTEKSRNELFSTRLTISEDMSHFQSFTRHLSHYTSRKLTNPSDAYKALYGISNALYKGRSGILNGLPLLDFDRGLLWYPSTGNYTIERHEIQGEILPTWSWSSAMGLSDSVHYQGKDFYGTLAPWYCLNSHISSSSSIAALNAHHGSQPDDDWQVYMAIAIKEGCVENMSLAFSLETDNFTTVRELFDACWKDYRSFRLEAIPLTMKTDEIPHSIPTDGTKQGVIATRSQTARLRVTPDSSYLVNIINSEGDMIGQLCGDAANLREQALSPGYDSDIEFEFISLSLYGQAVRSYSTEKLRGKKYTDVDGVSLSKVPHVNVLMIVGNGGVARRRELGWIYLVEWGKLRREWKVVVLE
ncbi:heterokaryon incompatibility protein-domain-containing protein [Aspergillus cavernicola]|uniref:Heterokaryon incompatibility protein-domain-containing protein n=1 Tax=Aspergillus cavernicola TaxID=176166 RepID=A0ABR4IP47_9EURO